MTLVEVLVALGLLASAGIVASMAAASLLQLERAAHAEAVGLALAAEKLEELLASTPASRRAGNDETSLDGVDVARVWRVRDDEPTAGVMRLEVTARWTAPGLTMLTLVASAPGRSEP